jgi:ABC-type sugar transport system substrate-binding protein
MKMAKRRRMLAIVVAGLTLLASACSSDDGSTGGKDSLLVGIVQLQASSQFSSIQTPALEAAFKKRGWETAVVDPNGDAAAANTAMLNLIQRKVDVIVVQTFAASALVAGMAAAAKAGVPVFSTGGGPADPGMAGSISSNAVDIMNSFTIDQLKSDPKVELLALTFAAGPPCLARQKGLDESLADESNITVTHAPFSFPGADQITQTAATGWLQSHPETAGTNYAFWVCTSEGAGGVIAAESRLDRGPYPMFAWDNSPTAIQEIKDGTLTGVVDLPPAGTSEQLADMIAAQQKAGNDWKMQTTVDAKAVVITKDNLAESSIK